MTRFYQLIIVSLFSFMAIACQSDYDFDIGSPSWQQWVDANARTADEQGHGPDIGSDEWCDTVDNKLFEGESNFQPCSEQWNITVDRKLKNQ